VKLLSLGIGMVSQQGLGMLPAAETSNLTNTRQVNDVVQGSTASITIDGPLHVCWLDLSAGHFNLSISTDQGLRDI